MALSVSSFAVAESMVVIDTSEPSFGPSPFATGDNKAATTAHPIHLYRGSVIEYAQDLTLETPLSTWTNKRTYDSGLGIGAIGSESAAIDCTLTESHCYRVLAIYPETSMGKPKKC